MPSGWSVAGSRTSSGRPFTRDDDAVDLLARQLASPVRWIDVQHALRRDGA